MKILLELPQFIRVRDGKVVSSVLQVGEVLEAD
jgi:hypothetical protein